MRITKILLFLSMILFIINPKSVLSEKENTLKLQINSNEFLNFLKNQAYQEDVKKICSYEFCYPLDLSNLTYSFESLKKKYESYVLEKSGYDSSIEVQLKGFPITKIELNE